MSYIHHTKDFRHYCHVGNTAQHCRLGLFQDSGFAGDLEDSKSTSGENLMYFRISNIRSSQLDVQETKFLSRTVLQSLKSFLWMPDYVWMDYLLLIFGT